MNLIRIFTYGLYPKLQVKRYKAFRGPKSNYPVFKYPVFKIQYLKSSVKDSETVNS